MPKITRRTLIQLIKFGIVGVINTCVTLLVIFICKSVLGINEYMANGFGYVAGVINSFLWNRGWVFHASGAGKFRQQMAMFFIGFGICYVLQFLIVWGMTQSTFGDVEYDLGFFVISGYGIATLIGAVAYSVANFIYNRLVTFHVN